MMDFWPFLLLGLGLVFVVLEVFIPSAGILGTVAAACVVGGGVLAYRESSGAFGTYIGLSVVLVPIAMLTALKLFPRTPIGKHMTLGGSTFDPGAASAGGDEFRGLEGATGSAETPLRPAGKAMLAGRRVDVITRGEMIERGRPVRVVRIEGNRVFVAEDRGDPSPATSSNPSA